MPVLPLVGSTKIGIGLDQAGLLRCIDHRHADAIFDTVRGIEEFQLRYHLGFGALGDAAQLDQRRVANQLGNIICNFHFGLSL